MVYRLAVIDKNKCQPKLCNHECAKACPINRKNEPCIIIGNKASIDEKLCIGCRLCIPACPFEAINVINLPEELNTQALHRYSENGFKLFRAVVPIFGKTVGILGQNGIGKTTMISILAGLTYPDLGEPGKKPDQKEIIKYFKGNEGQLYFEKLFKNEISIAYKPQYVDAIPKEFKGTVLALLKKVDKTGKIEEITKELGIDNILDRKIESVSGGELQRIAIAATILKGANVMFFDEPSSYLDIKQRINVAKIISELVNKETSVNVIEHDLIVLDYIADLVHVMYGKESVYGVVSHPMASKNGINTYLDGYLRDENMRFREYAIRYESRPTLRDKGKVPLIAWPEIKKKLGDFHLDVSEGNILVNEVVGCLGENGTGKTTFARILAGELKPDNVKFKEKIKISYKPQYIKPESDSTVAEMLASITKEFGTDDYKMKIIRPLQLERLLDMKLTELSGGELQRAAIAVCLSRDADLYLLDEPSAYLDVEQRLIIAKALREFIIQKNASALVIDHDLLFLDYISDRLLVFKGTPALKGETLGPVSMKEGMNTFLKKVEITLRRDPETLRPRVNKLGSVLDRLQKEKNEYYYTSAK
jgi:ATP-binding cassette subfamily E protein 1